MLKIFILFTLLYIISTNADSTPCNKDIGILIDTSLSIPQRKLEVFLETFLKPFYAKFEISAQKTQFGLITFDKYSRLRFTLAENVSTIEPVRQFITRIDLALLQAKNELFTLSAGDREDKQNVLLVFTDGRPFPPETFLLFNKSLPFLRAQNVSIFAVGYGIEAQINTTVLREIGGDNVLIMYEDKTLGYTPFVDPIKKMVCSNGPNGVSVVLLVALEHSHAIDPA
ncbi:unnamed protein product [Porites evermanni]|uniref:VWFA domain-containing protein n=1 Tax=Porites evermanni TaxID=104178 RepID=A0ABN8M8Y5_9CNID|nr:unnamed protein product [Porites evermanni]